MRTRSKWIIGSPPSFTDAKVRTVLFLGLPVEAALATEMAEVAGLPTFPTLPLLLGQARHLRPVEIVIGTTECYETLDQKLNRVRTNVGSINFDTNLRLNTPQMQIEIA